MDSQKAWVTLVTNDNYGLGALVLGHSLKRVKTAHQLVALITSDVSQSMRQQLSSVFNLVQEVEKLDSRDKAALESFARPELGVTFTKIHCWNLLQYSKCVFLDADVLVVQNSDELFDREEISAAPDIGWPDCFNSGVFVFVPSQETFKKLYEMAMKDGSFDGGDQGLLNTYFDYWATKDIKHHLPFIYNMVSAIGFSYHSWLVPSFKAYGCNVKIVHFAGPSKPWHLRNEAAIAIISKFTDLWWEIFNTNVMNNLSAEMSGLPGALAGREKKTYDEAWHKDRWEQGVIDFMGRDRFDNIWKKISESAGLKDTPAPSTLPPSSEPICLPAGEGIKPEAVPQAQGPQVIAPPITDKSKEAAQKIESSATIITPDQTAKTDVKQETKVATTPAAPATPKAGEVPVLPTGIIPSKEPIVDKAPEEKEKPEKKPETTPIEKPEVKSATEEEKKCTTTDPSKAAAEVSSKPAPPTSAEEKLKQEQPKSDTAPASGETPTPIQVIALADAPSAPSGGTEPKAAEIQPAKETEKKSTDKDTPKPSELPLLEEAQKKEVTTPLASAQPPKPATVGLESQIQVPSDVPKVETSSPATTAPLTVSKVEVSQISSSEPPKPDVTPKDASVPQVPEALAAIADSQKKEAAPKETPAPVTTSTEAQKTESSIPAKQAPMPEATEPEKKEPKEQAKLPASLSSEPEKKEAVTPKEQVPTSLPGSADAQKKVDSVPITDVPLPAQPISTEALKKDDSALKEQPKQHVTKETPPTVESSKKEDSLPKKETSQLTTTEAVPAVPIIEQKKDDLTPKKEALAVTSETQKKEDSQAKKETSTPTTTDAPAAVEAQKKDSTPAAPITPPAPIAPAAPITPPAPIEPPAEKEPKSPAPVSPPTPTFPATPSESASVEVPAAGTASPPGTPSGSVPVPPKRKGNKDQKPHNGGKQSKSKK